MREISLPCASDVAILASTTLMGKGVDAVMAELSEVSPKLKAIYQTYGQQAFDRMMEEVW